MPQQLVITINSLNTFFWYTSCVAERTFKGINSPGRASGFQGILAVLRHMGLKRSARGKPVQFFVLAIQETTFWPRTDTLMKNE
jgi:hypothetical protein